MGRTIELVNVSDKNNNKFYRMTDNENGTWTAEWGRVGSSPQVQVYNSGEWNRKYREKLKKGYQDITSLKIEDENVSYSEDAGININEGEQLLRLLQSYASNAIKENYTISSQAVTPAQISAAQDIITKIGDLLTKKSEGIDVINKQLIQLYTTIPRQMKNVKNHLAADYNKAQQIVSDEQDLLDVMRQQVEMYLASKRTSVGPNKESLSSILGISLYLEKDQKVLDKIHKMCKDDARRIKNIYAGNNQATQDAFNEYIKKHSFDPTGKLLFHGSRNQNWLNILKTGLLIKPSGVITSGSMYGNGIYFADKAIKSIGYSSLRGSYWARGNENRGFIALYDVNTGAELEHMHYQGWMGSLDYKKLRNHGQYDSFFAKGGADLRNNEYIVYNSAQSTIRYLIEME